ncbi:MAG: tetratricopeptide repeat protein [Acidobacteriia bacterium]|nr:tetratricopeptide repeat protein [Terriglobia bacterium]
MPVIKLTFPLLLLPALLAAQEPEAFRRGLEALQQNQLDVALEQLSQAEKAAPTDARVRNFRGIALSRLGRGDEAAAEYREAVRLDPRMAEAYRNLGYLEWSRGHLEAAREALAAALKLSPNDTYAHYYLGRVELESGQFSEAISHLERARNLWPQEANFLLNLSAAYLGAHRTQEARNILRRLPSDAAIDDANRVRLGTLLFAARERPRALETFQDLARRNGNASWAQFDLALANLLAGDASRAAALASDLAKSEDSAPVWIVLGAADAQAGKHEDALRAFRQAAELAPREEERWLDLTRELMERQAYVDAVAAAQEGLKHNPRSYALHLRLGAAYLKAARYHEAEAEFRKLVDEEDPYPTSAIGLAQVLLRTSRPQQAAEELARVRERLGPSFLLAYFRGIALDRAGQPDAALRELQEAVRLNPRSAEAHQWLGKVELRLRQDRPAVAELREALRLDPNNAPARRLLAQAYAMDRNPQEAQKYLRQIEAGALPKAEGEEMADFFLPAFRVPPANPH